MKLNVDLVKQNPINFGLTQQYHEDVSMEEIRNWEKSGKFLLIRIYIGEDEIILRPQSCSYAIHIGKEMDDV